MPESEIVRVERDPSAPTPELEGQASAKSAPAWRFSYRPCGSAEPWKYVEATDPGLDGILRRAGYRRIQPERGVAPMSDLEPE